MAWKKLRTVSPPGGDRQQHVGQAAVAAAEHGLHLGPVGRIGAHIDAMTRQRLVDGASAAAQDIGRSVIPSHWKGVCALGTKGVALMAMRRLKRLRAVEREVDQRLDVVVVSVGWPTMK